MENEEFELTDAERAALAALPRELPPGDLLEERVVRDLRAAGYIATRSASRWKRHALRAAAAVLLFVGGAATGRYLLAPDYSLQQAAEQAIEQSDSPAGSAGSPASEASGSRAQPTTPVRNGEPTVAQREMWL